MIPSIFSITNPRSEAEMQKVKRTSLVEKDELLLQKVMKISAEQNQIEVNARKIDNFPTLCAF